MNHVLTATKTSTVMDKANRTPMQARDSKIEAASCTRLVAGLDRPRDSMNRISPIAVHSLALEESLVLLPAQKKLFQVSETLGQKQGTLDLQTW